jgi:hypothetical protein
MTSKHRPVAVEDVPLQRTGYRRLIAANPNYFGTFMDSDLPVIEPMTGNTTYEELTCVSYNPDRRTLEATIAVKLGSGYSGGLCSNGSSEYVRFFLDYGSGWVDVGAAATTVHDIPASVDCSGDAVHPLSHVVTVDIDPQEPLCQNPSLPRARAILSWETMPTAGDPDFSPVWGDVHECPVQIKPRPPFFFELPDLFDVTAKLELPPVFEAIADQPIPIPDPGPLALPELAERFGRDVEPHRFGLVDIQNAMPAVVANTNLALDKLLEWKQLGLDWSSTLSTLDEQKANVSYEELECVGLDNGREALVASFKVKRPTGYSGGLCEHGSNEYVAFWADWDNTCDWTYLGTAEVRVHDIPTIPADGLCYAAVLPVDLTHVRRDCDEASPSRIRAVLSWSVPPSTTDPDDLTTWGNRLDEHVQVAPGPVVVGVTPLIGLLGGIAVAYIDDTSGLTTSSAVFALNNLAPDAYGRPCPFARRVVVQGPLFPGYKYRVETRLYGTSTWSTVVTPLTLTDVTGTVFTSSLPDSGGWFDYIPHNLNVNHTLAWWDTAGDAKWEVRLLIQGVAGQDVHVLQLDNTGPTVDIDIDILAGNCGKFPVGTVLEGTFTATDAYFGSFSLSTEPFAGPIGPDPALASTSPASSHGWKLDTTGMQPCGYVARVSAVDRAIIDSAAVGHHASATVGYCLEVPPQA